MTSATLHSPNLAQTAPPSVGDALQGLGVAARRLGFALWAAAMQRPVVVPRVLTAFEEAEQLRAFADEQLLTDPRFAQDLYAAADRHEMAARPGKM